MQYHILGLIRRSILYKKKHLEHKDMNRKEKIEVVDDLESLSEKEFRMGNMEEYAHYKEDEIKEDKKISPKDLLDSGDKKEAKREGEPDWEIRDELSLKQTEGIILKKIQCAESKYANLKNKIQAPLISDYNSKPDLNNLTAEYLSVYNSQNLQTNLGTSKNQYIRIYDDMMNDKSNNSAEKLAELKIKIFDFVKMNPISIDIADMLVRLGVKLLSLEPIDNKGSLECYENALKLYNKINDDMINVIKSEKNNKSARRNSEDKSHGDSSMVVNPNITHINTLNQYKHRAVRIRISETMKKLTYCYIAESEMVNAHKNISESLKLCANLFSEYSKEVADCLFTKAYCSQIENNIREAEDIYNKSLALYISVFKYNNINYTKISHIEIADCYFKLGLVKEKQKNFNLSMEYYNIALIIYRNHFKMDDNLECAVTMMNMGLLYEIQDNNDKSLTLYNQVRDIYAKIKPDGQAYIESLIKSAHISIKFNKYDEACRDLINALTVIVKKNNCESLDELLELILVDSEEYSSDLYYHFFDLADVSFLLAKIYTVLEFNKHQEGFETLRIVIELMPPHKDFVKKTYKILKKLLENLNTMNYKEEWEQDIVDCVKQFIYKMDMLVEENKRNLKADDNSVNEREENIVQTHQNSINSELNIQIKHSIIEIPKKEITSSKIMSMREDEFALFEKKKKKDETDFFTEKILWLETLGKNCSRIKLYKSAIELFLKCIIYLENLEDSINNKNKICELMNNIAMDYTLSSNFESAKVFFEKILDYRIKMHDKDDLRIASAYNNLANAYNRIKDNVKALEYWQLGMEIKKNSLRDDEDPRVGKDYYNFSIILLSLKEYDTAIQYMLDALYIFDKKLGKTSRLSADACLLLGECYKINNNNVTALNYCARAMSYYVENLEEEDYTTIKSRLLFAICLSLASKYDRAVPIFKIVIEKFIDREILLKTFLFVEGVYEYAKCLDWTNKFAESLKYFEIFIKIADKNWTAERLSKVVNKITQLVRKNKFLFFRN